MAAGSGFICEFYVLRSPRAVCARRHRAPHSDHTCGARVAHTYSPHEYGGLMCRVVCGLSVHDPGATTLHSTL
eukprot:3715844-Prymnesium_polylepis.1